MKKKPARDAVEAFMALYPSNPRSYGCFNPNTPKPVTVKGIHFGRDEVQSHLDGGLGLGAVPILDDDTCMWAAIDIDTHGKNPQPVDLTALEAQVRALKLPLVVCRSKSGGAHCYLFFQEPNPAPRVKTVLDRWAAKLGHRGAEVFPKQAKLIKEANGQLQLGNWINFPYYDVQATIRWAIHLGQQLSFDEFIELAESKRYSFTAEDDRGDEDYEAGPPCLQAMLQNPIDEGNRNTAVFQAGVFLKRAFKDDWRQRLSEFNQNGLATPLTTKELKSVTGSVARKDYQYKCREEPCKALCSRELCRTRPFGITADDARVNEIPPIDRVEKIIGTPIKWALRISGKEIEITTPQLFDYNQVRQAVGESLHVVMPRIKNDEWDMYLREIMAKVEIRRGSTAEDIMFLNLCEFLSRASSDKSKTENDRRQDLQRHVPTLITFDGAFSKDWGRAGETAGGWFYAFRAQDFANFLRRKKALTIPDHQIPAILYKILGPDACRDRIRTQTDSIRNVWTVPEDAVSQEAVPTREFKTEY